MADAAVSGTLACRTGYTLAKTIVERRDEFGVTWFLIDDLSRMSRNTIESLQHGELAEATGVRVVGASDGYDSANLQSSLLLPVLGSMNEAFITQLRSKVKRGMDDAFRRGDNIQPPGVGYRLVDLKDANGNLVITHKGTIEKVVEIDAEAAEWTRRGAEMIAREGKSPIELARLFNEQKVGGRQTWSDNMIRKLCSRERLVGREVFRTTRQEKNRTTGKVRYTNRGYKSARIIDEAVLGTVMATLFTDDFLADLTADVNKRLAWITRQPIPSTKKLEQEIARDGLVSKTDNLRHVFWTCRRRRHILTTCRNNPVSATILNGQRGGRKRRTTICRSSRRLSTWKLGRF